MLDSPWIGSTRLVAYAWLTVTWCIGPVAHAVPCEAPDNGAGTVDLPVAGCGYLSPDDVHLVVDGLPADTEILAKTECAKFFNVEVMPGGSLEGEIASFDAYLFLDMTGTGELTGFDKFLAVPIHCEVHTGPRTPGDPVQRFPGDVHILEGEIFGDPDFELLSIHAGTDFGMPSPGETTLTRLPDGNWNVDSFFDIAYRIEFVGARGSMLDGLSGITTASSAMQGGEPATVDEPCMQPDDGTGTVVLPPRDCNYLAPHEIALSIDGLPPETSIWVHPTCNRFIDVVAEPGGSLGGEIQMFDASLALMMQGTGELEGFSRSLIVPVACETNTGPRDPSKPVQLFASELMQMQGMITGDPDFELLQIVAGTDAGLPSPGATQLTQSPTGGDWTVDSFFDIAYRIDFVGAPGSVLEDLSGSTVGAVRMGTGDETAVATAEIGPPIPGARLEAARPNPFSPTTSLPFVLDRAGLVEIRIYDVAGRRVRSLVNEDLDAGRHEVSWNGRDAGGNLVGLGTYFYELRVDGGVIAARRAVMLQ